MSDEGQVVYLLWAQHSDRSGEEFIAVYEGEDRANQTKAIIERAMPPMQIKISAVPWYGESF